MSSSPTPKQWFWMIVVNVAVSAITTLFVVRALMAPIAPAPASSPPQTPAPAAQTNSQPTPTPAGAEQSPPANPPPTETAAPQPAAPIVAPAPAAAIPTTSAQVRISTVLFPGQLSREVVVLVNEGDTVDLTGWVLASSSGIAYTFGNVTLLKDSFINLHTTSGADVPTDLFWDRAEPAWKAGDWLTLSNGNQEIATFTVVER